MRNVVCYEHLKRLLSLKSAMTDGNKERIGRVRSYGYG